MQLTDDEIEVAFAGFGEGERAHAAKLSGTRRREWISGRAAMRDLIIHEVLADDRGAPVLPEGMSGSISHKEKRAAALLAPVETGHVGIDIERQAPRNLDIASRILTANEVRVAGAELLRVFSIKEAIYKAIDPIVRRYVGFQEVELVVGEGGRVEVRVVDPHKLPVAIEAWWTEHDTYWLSTARARRL